MRPRLPTIAKATSESASRISCPSPVRVRWRSAARMPVAASPPMMQSHAGSTELSGPARSRGPVAHGKPVAGLTV